MAKATVRLLPTGGNEVLRAASGLHGYQLKSFLVGDAAGYVAADTDTNISGNLVYTGTPSLMSIRQLSTTATRITLTIPEGVGPFLVGNIMIFTSDTDDGSMVPFAEVVLPFQVKKYVAQYDNGILNYANPGSRMLVSITLNHQILQPDDPTTGITVVVDVISPEYASLAYYDTEANVPSAALIPWSQFVVNNLLATGGPGLMSKRSDNTLWIYPFVKNIHHPKYHVMSGGVNGDSYAVDKHDFLWGGRFTDYLTAAARGKIGGMSFSTYSITGDNYYGGLSFAAR